MKNVLKILVGLIVAFIVVGAVMVLFQKKPEESAQNKTPTVQREPLTGTIGSINGSQVEFRQQIVDPKGKFNYIKHTLVLDETKIAKQVTKDGVVSTVSASKTEIKTGNIVYITNVKSIDSKWFPETLVIIK